MRAGLETPPLAIVGGGPAGLAAAEAALDEGVAAVVLEAKPTVARKFLMAGKSGLNLTKDEPRSRFLSAYGAAADRLRPMIETHGPAEATAWAERLGERMFAGSSGRVFPMAMKGSPLLRRWLSRLAEGGVEVRARWRWAGWEAGALAFETPVGRRLIAPRASVLALGGASWPRLGSDGAWAPWLAERGVEIVPFRPANMGVEVAWSAHLRERFAGHAVKPVRITAGRASAKGECVITEHGLEGGAVYAVSAAIRERLAAGDPTIRLDLAPDRTEAAIARALAQPRGSMSLANQLRRRARIAGAKAALLREAAAEALSDPAATAAAIKSLPLTVLRPRPLAEAISSAGGIAWEALDEGLAIRALPGTFAAGEMIDWEAPTGGYLLTACLATGAWAGRHAARAAAATPSPGADGGRDA